MSVHPKMEETAANSRKHGRSGAWTRLKKRWNRKGVVEVDIDHYRYELLNCIRNGIRDLITNFPELGPKESLTPDDYSHKMKKTVETADGQSFEFTSYSSPVYASIRHAVGLSEEAYLNAVAPETLPYLEFVSNSKSGQFFYISNDKSFFLKTEKHYYVRILKNLLGEYLEHFLNYPHSLIVKILGCYSIKVARQQKIYFYVMQSVFYPEERIDLRYDIKGCLAGRYQTPPKPGSDVITVLKDQNFNTETIALGNEKDWFLRQFDIDVNFLRELGVIDYSLLVGVQELQSGETKKDFGEFVLRVKKSIAPLPKSGSNPTSPVHKNNPTDGEEIELDEIDGSARYVKHNSDAPPRLFSRRPSLKGHRFSFMQHRTEETDGEVNKHNRRLLPNTKNPLHVLDGAEYRYYLGIIDFLTLYECRQRTGWFVKTVKHCCGDHSTLPPAGYATRFRNFILEHVS